MPDGIVVVGHRYNTPLRFEASGSSTTGPVTASQPHPGDQYGTPADALRPIAGVNLHVTNTANLPAVRDAATRVAGALVQLLDSLALLDPNQVIALSPTRSTTVGQLIQDINNTVFTVSDRPPSEYKNAGVGSARRGSPNIEEINFQAIVGEGGYGAPTYVDNAGVVGILLHEMGHISIPGSQIYNASVTYWRSDPVESKRSDFYQTTYAANLEAFANKFMNTAAAAIRLNLQGMLPGGYSPNFREPTEIYNSHVPPRQQE